MHRRNDSINNGSLLINFDLLINQGYIQVYRRSQAHANIFSFTLHSHKNNQFQKKLISSAEHKYMNMCVPSWLCHCYITMLDSTTQFAQDFKFRC